MSVLNRERLGEIAKTTKLELKLLRGSRIGVSRLFHEILTEP